MCNSACVNESVIQSPLGISYHFSTCTRGWCNYLKMKTHWLIQCSVCLWVNLHDYTHLCIAVLYSLQVMRPGNFVKGVSYSTLNAPTQNAEHVLACALPELFRKQAEEDSQSQWILIRPGTRPAQWESRYTVFLKDSWKAYQKKDTQSCWPKQYTEHWIPGRTSQFFKTNKTCPI